VARLRSAIAARPDIEELRLFPADAPRVGIVSFILLGADPDAVGAALGHEHGIGVRVGLFCAHPLTRRLIRERRAGSTCPRRCRAPRSGPVSATAPGRDTSSV